MEGKVVDFTEFAGYQKVELFFPFPGGRLPEQIDVSPLERKVSAAAAAKKDS